MIFVTLGTQDKSFDRLLKAIDKLDLDEEIIVQAGSTKYESSKMKIFDYVSGEDFEKYIDKADIVITDNKDVGRHHANFYIDHENGKVALQDAG